jgi:hypothetical protein
MADSLSLDVDFQAMGQVLDALACRLLDLERLDPSSVTEDEFADSKNDALALAPLYRDFRRRAVETFGEQILRFAPAIGRLDELYGR